MSDLAKDVERAASTALALVSYHIYCLECWDPEKKDWIIAYVGMTTNLQHRKKQHFDICSGARRASAAIATYGKAQVSFRHLFSRSVSNTEAITSSSEACALETYLMCKHATIKHEILKMRDLLAHKNKDRNFTYPDISLPGEARTYQWNCKRSCVDSALIKEMGEKYEASIAKNEAMLNVEPGEVAEVMAAVEEAFALAVKEGEGVRGEPTAEELGTELVVCDKKKTMEVVTFTIDTPFMVAFNLVDKYEKMDAWRVVKREDFLSDLDLINDESLKMHDADVASFVRMFKLSCHTDKHDKFCMQMTADEAAGLLKSVKAWLGTKEESIYAASADKDVKKHYEWACELLAFVRGNEGKMPSEKPAEDNGSTEDQRAEKTLGQRLKNWLSGQNGNCEKRQQCNLYIVILRHFPSFVFRVRGGLAEQSANLIEELNAKLLAGFGIKTRMKAFMPHVRQLPRLCPECGADDKVYTKLHQWFSGRYHEDTDDILAGLPADVANAMRAIHDSKVESAKAKQKERSKKRTADF
ncbi:hypothetical protein N9S81_00435, partial [bacterium]|nr:hypothetical protein [bacterium]